MPVLQVVAGDNVALIEDPVLEQLRIELTGLGAYLRSSDAASNLTADVGAGAIGFAYGLDYDPGTLGRWASRTYGINVTLAPYNADNTGASDAAPAIQDAINDYPGRTIYCPAGRYRLNSGFGYVSSAPGVFTPGLHILGDGPGQTIFDSRVSAGRAINVDSDTTLEFQLFVTLEGFTLTTLAGSPPASSVGIRLRRAYNIRMDSVHVVGLTGSGAQFVMNEGDGDGCAMVDLERVRIENCGSGGNAWGIETQVTGAFNELSFLRMKHCFIQNNGASDAALPPTSGNIKWKGQAAHFDTCAVVLAQNCGLYIEGGAGLANTLVMTNCTFENNRRRHIYCTGIDGLIWNGGQMYSSDAYAATGGAVFDGSSNVVRGIDIRNIVVRATAGNAITAWQISGANAILDTCRVRGTIWQNFDYAGQSRFSGWRFDHVQQGCHVVALNASDLLFRPRQAPYPGAGNKTPLRLRGGGGGTPSTTGEWVEAEIPAAGILRGTSGLGASTRYYVYLYDNNGALDLEFSTTGFVTDSGSGYSVKTGDATRLYVGSVQTNASTQWLTTAGGWLNPLLVPGSQPGVFGFMWMDSNNRARSTYAVAPTSDTDGVVHGTQS